MDTVKTRVQGQPHHRLLKYHNMVQAYNLIWKEEGVLRGLYAGITPAMLGSGNWEILYIFLPVTNRSLLVASACNSTLF